jgi:hypothetical protein
VKPEVLQRAIDADAEWLEVHPMHKSIAASRQAGSRKQQPTIDRRANEPIVCGVCAGGPCLGFGLEPFAGNVLIQNQDRQRHEQAKAGEDRHADKRLDICQRRCRRAGKNSCNCGAHVILQFRPLRPWREESRPVFQENFQKQRSGFVGTEAARNKNRRWRPKPTAALIRTTTRK